MNYKPKPSQKQYIYEISAAVLSRLIVENQRTAQGFNSLISELPKDVQNNLQRTLFKYGENPDLSALIAPVPANTNDIAGILSADEILTTSWPEPHWIVPGIIPSGLTILAGAPKLGKSWLALQIAQAVAAGGSVLGQRVESGRALYMALEDPPRRLSQRMVRQNWPHGLMADFLTLGSFMDIYGDLRSGGGDRLTDQIEQKGYCLVVIDTLSRAIPGDQNDVGEMTQWLTPLQEIAHARNAAIILIDHHKKRGDNNPDAIADILGSTGKGAMADTIIGLYRERGKAGAKLDVTGRDVEEQSLSIYFERATGCWQLDRSDKSIPDSDQELVRVLSKLGRAGDTQIGKSCVPERQRGTVHKQLVGLEAKGIVRKSGQYWELANQDLDQ